MDGCSHCVVCYGVALNLTLTSESFRFLFLLFATIRASGQRILNVGSCSIICQCFRSICPMCVVLLLYGVVRLG